MQRRRVVVVGLDGASWDFMKRMIELGAMPHTKHELNKNSAKGVLESSYPPVTPSAWASITTGVNPGKHGIFDFLRTNPKTGEQKLITTLDLEHPRIYDMLAMQGIETLVFNPIPPYPIIPLKNLKIASITFCLKPLCYPNIMRRYIRTFPPEHAEELNAHKDGKLDKDLFLELKHEKTDERVAVVEEALERESWSLAWIRLQDPDNMFHFAYNEAFAGHSKVIKIFTLIDKLIETANRLADLLVLVSDHGFKSFKCLININTILYIHGFTKPTTSQSLQDHSWMGVEALKHLIPGSAVDRKKMRLHIPPYLLKMLTHSEMTRFKKLGRKVLELIPSATYEIPGVDTSSSKAYLPTHYSYGVLVKDNKDIEVIRKLLLRYEGIMNVKSRENLYWGPYVKRAPNLMILLDHESGFKFGSNRIPPEIYYHRRVYDHHPHGIISFIGEDVTSTDIGLIKAWDVAPTIMAYMGVPVPHDTDAKTNCISNIPIHNERHYDYTSKWRTLKNVRMIKHKISQKGKQHQSLVR